MVLGLGMKILPRTTSNILFFSEMFFWSLNALPSQVKDGKENVRMKIYTGEALYEKKSIHMLKSIPNLNNLIANQCARSLLYPIPFMFIKAAINMHLFIHFYL
jgi:hypothetical protein